jgi:CRISPR-associated protein Cas5t
MRVLKIVLEGTTTSFRYPQFMIGVQPSFPMPPPSTIYGHICSAVGEWVDPDGLAFAYHFTAQESFEDLEHIHVLKAAGGKLPSTIQQREGEGNQVPYPKVLEGNTNPFRRQIVFRPRLVLYLNRPEWELAFRRPRYAVVLGRSQDLATYTSISVIELETSKEAYFEHTLLPYEMATQTAVGIVTLMPRWISLDQQRRTDFARYLILQRRVQSQELMRFEPTSYLTDPTSAPVKGNKLGLVFHTFVGAQHATFNLA